LTAIFPTVIFRKIMEGADKAEMFPLCCYLHDAMSFPRTRESSVLLDARFRGHDNTTRQYRDYL